MLRNRCQDTCDDHIDGQLNPEWVEWLMGVPCGWTALDGQRGLPKQIDRSIWDTEPENVPRLKKGIQDRTARIKGLGNMVCPQQAWPIFAVIMETARHGKIDK